MQSSMNEQDQSQDYETTARLCARFIIHTFACPRYQPSSSGPQVELRHFIEYALRKTDFHCSIAITALALLQRLKSKYPTTKGPSGHRLFITALLIASKVMVDNTYWNKSWPTISRGMFQLHEINQLEREICEYLNWELSVDAFVLQEFETMIRRDFSGFGPYPTYTLLPTKASTI